MFHNQSNNNRRLTTHKHTRT